MQMRFIIEAYEGAVLKEYVIIRNLKGLRHALKWLLREGYKLEKAEVGNKPTLSNPDMDFIIMMNKGD